MPLSDSVKGAVVGAILGAVLAGGIGFGHYVYIDKPTMQTTDKAAADAEAARQRAETRAAQQAEQHAALQKRSDEIKKQFQQAKGQFINHLTDAVNDGPTTVPGGEPGRPVSSDVVARTMLTRARHIVDERDRARNGIQSLTTNLQRIYDELDSDIDDLKHLIDNPPVDQRQLQGILKQLAQKWPTKLRLLDEIAQNNLKDIGCPMQFASNP